MSAWKRKNGSDHRSAGQGGLLVVCEHSEMPGKWIAKYRSPNGNWNAIGKAFDSRAEAKLRAEKHLRLR